MTADSSLSNALLEISLLAIPGVTVTPVTVQPETTVKAAIALMDMSSDCCAIVTQQQRPIGIFTASDLVHLMAHNPGAIAQPISAVMRSDILTVLSTDIQEDNIQSALALLRTMIRHQRQHLPIVNEQGQLMGLAIQSELQKALVYSAFLQPTQQTPSDLRQETESAKLQQAGAQLDQSYRELTDTNQKLTHTLSKLQSTEYSLQKTNADLESRVAARTAELYQSERQWRSLLDNVQLAVIGLDIEGKVTYANPFFLELSGYTTAEVMEKDWLKHFIPSSEYIKLEQYFQQLCNQPDTPPQYQNAILTRSGEARLIVWNNTVLYDTENNIIGTMSIGEDITERAEVDRMKGEFVAMVSHELRTPLTAIHGGLKLLAQDVVSSESEEGKSLLQLAAKNSQRLVRLVDDILTLESLELGESPLRKQTVDTQTVTAQVIESFKLLARPLGIVIELSDPGLAVLADSDRLVQILTNLLDNAIKFSPPDSAIQLAVSRIDQAVRFTVCDQGVGIPLEQQHRIFDRFVQVDTMGNSEKGGTGLGLTICKNIVEQHGGKIWVESTLSKGCCFYFTLPND